MDSINPNPKHIPDDDLRLQNYQDDLDTASHIHDPMSYERDDDPTKELGVSPHHFKAELDKYDFDEAGHGDDDMREQIEDWDEEIEDDIGEFYR